MALLDESTKDIKEQKLATVLAVRALEEKGAVEASMKTLEANARDNLSHGLSALSFYVERNQSIKFLAIARTCADLTLLNSAISTAIKGGIATWDFNLKNALKQRDELQNVEDSEATDNMMVDVAPSLVDQEQASSPLQMLLQ
ncbi:unnamed protein product [Albugo candida]|uniref:Uncharacterized protein n=1 Tax=Albugo candida TaxID=65357 RepID=A0A024GA90_9STRA|nr:unnamed protein product [Albugo candida]|eukprot:CCI43688.1 unnamed protein product [Albugo candida]